MKYLENEVIKVAVADHGAELSSVYDKENEAERVWCADPAVWNRHAPILFPFVGRVRGGVYRYKGQEYTMKTQHGFARDKEFTCVEATDTQIVHSLKSTEETKAIYPFDFELLVTHRLDAENPRLLHILWEVKNTGDDKMYYIIGGHPAFNIPEGEDRFDYYLEVPGKDVYEMTELNPETGFGTPWVESKLALEDGFWKLNEKLYDTLIFDNYQVEEIRLARPDKTPYITMKCAGFPSMGVWSTPTAPFVCLEPWIGRTDNDDSTGNLEDKPDVQILEAGDSKVYEYTVEFHK